MLPRSLTILLLSIAFLYPRTSGAKGIIKGDLLVCSNSSGAYTVQGQHVYDVNWSVDGGVINSGQNSASINITWSYVENGRITISAKDSATSNTIYDTLKINIDTTCVWPGDANHDHTVSYTDLLAVAEGIGKAHTTCSDTSTLWMGVPRCEWHDTLPLGIELKHVDCNGDGHINLNDTNAIIRNYSRKGMYKNADAWQCPPPQTGDPELRVYTGSDTLKPGRTLFSSVYFGSSVYPVNQAYGMAFSFYYDPEIFDASSVQFDLSKQWITTGCKDSLVFYKNFPAEGRIDFAFSRTDGTFKTYGGELVTLKFHIKDQIPMSKKLSKFTLGEFQFISGKGSLSGVLRVDDSSAVAGNVGIDRAGNIDNNISVYPDPASEDIEVNCTSGIRDMILYNALGACVWQQKYSGTNTHEKIVLPASLHGIYILQVSDRQGFVSRKKVMVQ